MNCYLIFEREYVRVYLGPTEDTPRIVAFHEGPGDAQHARAQVVAVLRNLMRRANTEDAS